MSSGTEEMEADMMPEAIQECKIFRYGTAKISQSLRNLAMHSFSL